MNTWISEDLKKEFSNKNISFNQLSNKAEKIAVYSEIGPFQCLYCFSDGSKLLLKNSPT